jgi:hypothetical protein
MVTDLGVRHLWNITPRDTMAPSAITWTPIYERLGTRRLGTVFLPLYIICRLT